MVGGSQDVDIGERWNHLDHKQPLTRCIIIERYGKKVKESTHTIMLYTEKLS
jgi:hypothetical protein